MSLDLPLRPRATRARAVAPGADAHDHSLPPAPVNRRPRRVLIGLSLALAVAAAAFMTLGAQGSWDFVLPFRGTKLAALVLVSAAIAVSTVIFQTLTDNRILTPSIMGFDALYVLLQTGLVFSFGSSVLAQLDSRTRFGLEVVVMVTFAVALYRWLLIRARRSLHVLVLTGVVAGIFFRSLSTFMQRLIDPNEFVVLQDALFASFNTFDATLLVPSGALVAAGIAVAWRLRRRLDVLTLGQERATMLGVDHKRTVIVVLVVVAVLVSVSTALVGPITFFGLIAANLAYRVAGTHRHAIVLPVAALLSMLMLIGGQTILERVFSFNTALSVIIELCGGIMFLALLLRGEKQR